MAGQLCVCVCLILETLQRLGYSSWVCQDKTERSDIEGNDRQEMNTVCGPTETAVDVVTGALLQRTDGRLTVLHRLDFAGHRSYWPSHGYRGVRLFRPVAYNVLQLSGVWDVVARLVLSQDLHQRTQLQPPLLFRDPVTADRRGNLSTAVMAFFGKMSYF